MGSVFNATNNTTYELVPEVPLILGRLQVNKKDQRISRHHVQITLLNDQRCFVKALSSNPCTLDNAILPKKLTEEGKFEGEEVEAFNDQWIHLLPGRFYPFRLTLPKSMTTPTPRKLLIQHETDKDSDGDDDDSDSIASDEQQCDSLMDINTPGYEDDRVLSYSPSISSSIISTESSLIGGEPWSD
ncbi:hypothetical protein BC941DRAFT_419484 [Chlamydoabsidia padenii]|nr:hypothetical protein BC941DRAFT_419484 [Chlamydoabsidia padenii]